MSDRKEPIIKMKGFKKSFGSKQIHKGIDFEL